MNAITLYLLLSIMNYELATEDFNGQKSSMFFFSCITTYFITIKQKNILISFSKLYCMICINFSIWSFTSMITNMNRCSPEPVSLIWVFVQGLGSINQSRENFKTNVKLMKKTEIYVKELLTMILWLKFKWLFIYLSNWLRINVTQD